MKLRQAQNLSTLKMIENLYIQSFPKEERKPFSLILQKQKEEKVEILCIEKENNFFGLMILAKDNDNILLDYFAIKKEYQSQGIGSNSLKLLFNKYKNKNIIIEIESTKINSNNQILRQKRKDFYLRNNFKIQDFCDNLFSVEMEILTNNNPINFQEYLNIYKKSYGNDIIKNIKLIQE